MNPNLSAFTPISPIASAGLVPSVAADHAFIPTVVQPGKEPLPPKVAAMIPKFAAELSKNTHLMDYGKPATDRLANYADKYLDSVQLINIDEFAKPLTEVLVACSSINASSITTGSINARLPLWTKMRTIFAGTKTRVLSQFNTVREQIDAVVKEVNVKEQNFRNIITTLDELYELNMNEYFHLGAYLEAGQIVLKDKNAEMDQFKIEAVNSQDPLLAVKIQERQDWLDELGRVLSDLERIQFTCIQTAQRIRQQQRTATVSIRKFGHVKSMAIPLWKKNAAEVIAAIESRKGIDFMNKVADTTNANYKAGAALVAKNAVDSAKMLERGVIDFDSLSDANNSLISSITEIIQIAETGKQERQETTKGIEALKASIHQNVVLRKLS